MGINKMVFDPLANGATLVKPKTNVFDPIANGATPVNDSLGINVVKSSVQGAVNSWNTGEKQSLNPLNIGKAFTDTYKGAIINASDKLDKAVSDFGKVGALQYGTDLAQVGLGAVGAILSPISATFKAAEVIPVVGFLAKGINSLFGAIGGGGGEAGIQVLNNLPIPAEVKNTLAPVVRDASALAGQILAGKAGLDSLPDKVSELANHSKTILHSIKETADITPQITDSIKKSELPPPPPIETPSIIATKPLETIKPVEPTIPASSEIKTPQGQYPTIRQGGEIKMVEGTPIKIIDGVNTFLHKDENGNWTVSEATTGRNLSGGGFPNSNFAVKEAKANIDNAGVDNFKKLISENQLPKSPQTITNIIKPEVSGTPMVNVRTAKSAADVSQTMAEKGFQKFPETEQAKYSPTTKAEQIQKVSDLMTNKIDEAKQMIRGDKNVPNDVLPQVLFNAMEEHALMNGDAGLLRDLAQSPIATKLSEAGQALGSHGYNDNPNSPVQAIREITQIREKALSKTIKDTAKEKSKVVSEIDKEIKSVKQSKQTWSEFVRSIQC
jgi:hypothetical protein